MLLLIYIYPPLLQRGLSISISFRYKEQQSKRRKMGTKVNVSAPVVWDTIEYLEYLSVDTQPKSGNCHYLMIFLQVFTQRR